MISINTSDYNAAKLAYTKIYNQVLSEHCSTSISSMDDDTRNRFVAIIKEKWSDHIFCNPIIAHNEDYWSESSEASIKAKEMGLTHKGFGKWADKDGTITHQTLNGALHKVNSFEHHEAKNDAAKKRLHAKIANNVAKEGHEEWRKGWAAQNGGAKGVPKIKKTTDAQHIKKHGTDQVDINTHYKNLPSDWKGENEANGKSVADFLIKTGAQKDAKSVEKGAEHVHNEWMKRNKKEEWNAHLHVPYHKLPDNEKQKDRDMINVGIKHYHR